MQIESLSARYCSPLSDLFGTLIKSRRDSNGRATDLPASNRNFEKFCKGESSYDFN